MSATTSAPETAASEEDSKAPKQKRAKSARTEKAVESKPAKAAKTETPEKSEKKATAEKERKADKPLAEFGIQDVLHFLQHERSVANIYFLCQHSS